MLTSKAVEEESPRPHTHALIIQQCPRGVFRGVGQTTVHVLTHKVREEHIVAHEPHPTKQLGQEESPQHCGGRAHPLPCVLGKLDHLGEEQGQINSSGNIIDQQDNNLT